MARIRLPATADSAAAPVRRGPALQMQLVGCQGTSRGPGFGEPDYYLGGGVGRSHRCPL